MSGYLAGFGAPPYELVLGSPAQTLYVPADVLRTIPYFANALSSENYQEVQDKKFEIPDVDPQAAAKVLELTYVRRVSPAKWVSYLDNNDNHSLIEDLKAWVVADRWCAESLANGLVDDFVSDFSLTVPSVLPEMLLVFDRSGHYHCGLYKCLVAQWVWEVRTSKRHWKEAKECKVGEGLRQLSKTVLEDLVSAMVQYIPGGRTPILEALHDPCSLHRHERTKACLCEKPDGRKG